MESYNNPQTFPREPSQVLQDADMSSHFAIATLNSDVLPENDIMSIVMKRKLGGVISGVRESSPFAPPEKKSKLEINKQCGFKKPSNTINKGYGGLPDNMVHQPNDKMSSSGFTMSSNEDSCTSTNFQSLDTMAWTEIKTATKNSEFNCIGHTGTDTSKSNDDLSSEKGDENTSEKLAEKQEEGLDKTKDFESLVENKYLNVNGSTNDREIIFNDFEFSLLKAKAAQCDQSNVDSHESVSQLTCISVSESNSPNLRNYDQGSLKFEERSQSFTDNLNVQQHSKDVSKYAIEKSPEEVKECNVSFEIDEACTDVEPNDLNVSEVTTEKEMFQIANVFSIACKDELQIETKNVINFANDSISYNLDQEDIKEKQLKNNSQEEEEIIGPVSFDFETQSNNMEENKSVSGSFCDAMKNVEVKLESMSDSSHNSNDEVKPMDADEVDSLNDKADQTDLKCYYNDEDKGKCPNLDNGDDDDEEVSEHYDIENVKHDLNYDQGPGTDKVVDTFEIILDQGPANFEGHGTVYIENLEMPDVKRGTTDEMFGSKTSTCSESCFDWSNATPLHLQTSMSSNNSTSFFKYPVVNDLTVEKLLEQNHTNLKENLEVVEKLQEIRFNKYRKIPIAEKKHIVEFAKVNSVSSAAKIYGISRSAISSWTHIDFTDIDDDIFNGKKDCMLENKHFEELVKRVKIKTSKIFKSEKAYKFKSLSREDKLEVSRYARLIGLREMARRLDIGRGTISRWMRQFPYMIKPANQDVSEISDRTVDSNSNSNSDLPANEDKKRYSEKTEETYINKPGIDESKSLKTDSDDLKFVPAYIEKKKKKDNMANTDCVRDSRCSSKDSGTIDRKMKGKEDKEEKADEIDDMIAVRHETPNVDKCFEDAKVMIEGTILENDTFFEKLFKRVVECRADKYKSFKASEKLEAVRYAKRIGVRRTAKILGLGTGTMSGWITKYQAHLGLTSDFSPDLKQSDNPLLSGLDSSLDTSENDTDLLNASLKSKKNLSSSTVLDKPEEVLAVKLILKDRFDYFRDKIEHARKFKFKNITQDEKIKVVQCTKVAGIRPTARVLNMPIGTLSGWITKYTNSYVQPTSRK